MPISLVRQGHSTDVTDDHAVREWMMERVRQDVRAKGCAHPRVHLLGESYEETLDLDAMSRQQPAAHPGATFQGLRSRPDIERRFLVMNATGERPDGTEQSFAVLFEELDDEGRRRWWMAMLPYERDATSGVGVPADDWAESDGETSNVSRLPPYIVEFASPPPGTKPASVLGPGTLVPDVRVRFETLPSDRPVPADVTQFADTAQKLVAAGLLAGAIGGNVVVRLAGRDLEIFVLGEQQPASLDDMIRYVANRRSPRAEGVALVQVAILPHQNPPKPGLFIRAEYRGHSVEAFLPIGFPDGPA